MTLSNRVAVVTAAGGAGIGRAIALKLATANAFVAVTDRSAKRAEQVAGEIRQAGGRALAWELDVSRSDSVNSVFDAIVAEAGPIGILVNNAGISVPTPVADMSDEIFDQTLRVSLYGTFNCTRKALQSMLPANYGRIVNISSYVAFAGSPDLAHYAAAKAGIVGFTKSLALEVGRSNVTVNAIAPGIILNDHLNANRAQFSAEIQDRLEKGTPLGRHGRPEDIAAAALTFIASDDPFVTGATLPVSGGLYMI